MGEKPRSRENVEQVTRAYREHYQKLGRPVSQSEAKAIVGERARVRDQQRADGSAKNKTKGRESGKRREAAAREQREAAAENKRIHHSGRVVIDIGRGRK